MPLKSSRGRRRYWEDRHYSRASVIILALTCLVLRSPETDNLPGAGPLDSQRLGYVDT